MCRRECLFFCLILFFGFACNNTQKNEEPITVPIKSQSTIPYLQNGEYEKKHPNGKLSIKGTFKHGNREGQWVSWYDNGQAWSEVVYKKGKKNGPTTSWYKNGNTRYKGEYINDVKAGKWSYWSEKGDLVKEKEYK